MEGVKISWISLLIATLCVSIQATAPNRRTMTETIPAYAITNYIDFLNSSKCRTEMEQFREAVDRRVLWGLRMLDASGKVPSGFVNGNNFWLGSRLDCKFLSARLDLPYSEKIKKNNSLYRNPAEEQPPYELHFFGANIQNNSTLQYHLGSLPYEDRIVLGLCLPASCTENEIATMLQEVLQNDTLLAGQLFSSSFKLINVNDLVDDYKWLLNGQMITIIVILVLLCGTLLIGTAIDLKQRFLRKEDKFVAYKNNNICELKSNMEEKREIDHEEITLPELKHENRIKQCFLCFSIYSNVLLTFQQNEGSEGIAIFHSMKFLGMVWILMGHTMYFGKIYFLNKTDVYGFLETEPFMQILNNATLSVDTFFFIGGFLLTYLFLKGQETEKKPKDVNRRVIDVVQMVVKRYIRFTPTYFFIIMITILNSTWHDQVLLLPISDNEHTKCSKYWWRNLLYINNFFSMDDICLSWSWYLPNDLQFFVFGAILLTLAMTHYKSAITIGATTLLGSIISSGFLAYNLNFRLTLNDQLDTATDLYLRPWARIGPYMIGMATAQLLANWNYKLNLSKKMLTICWLLSIFCNCSIIFAPLNKNMSTVTAALYLALSRTCWAIGVAWCVVACVTNNAGLVNKLLSLPAWVPLGRLTYCSYLINPFLIGSILRFATYPTFLEPLSIGATSLGFVLATYVCALALSAATEVPFIRLLRLLVTPNRTRK